MAWQILEVFSFGTLYNLLCLFEKMYFLSCSSIEPFFWIAGNDHFCVKLG